MPIDNNRWTIFVWLSIAHRLTDSNRYQLTSFIDWYRLIDWFSEHQFPSIGYPGWKSLDVRTAQRDSIIKLTKYVVVNSHWDINRKTVLEDCGYQLKQLRVFNAYLLGRKEENLTQYSEKQLNIRAAEQNNHVALLDYQSLFRKRARAPPPNEKAAEIELSSAWVRGYNVFVLRYFVAVSHLREHKDNKITQLKIRGKPLLIKNIFYT